MIGEDGSGSKRRKKRKSENVPDVVEEEVETVGEREGSKKKKVEGEDVSNGIEDEMETDEKGGRRKRRLRIHLVALKTRLGLMKKGSEVIRRR